MQRSDSIGKLSEALAAAQAEIKGAAKDSANSFFKSKYADLASIRDACAGALSKHGLAVMQFPRTTEGGIEVETMLSHVSGEWVCETLSLPVAKADAQGVGSAITYARRYALAAIVGVAPEDDDGNAAAASAQTTQISGRRILDVAASKGTAALELAWKALSGEQKQMLKNDLSGYKAKAIEHDQPKDHSAKGERQVEHAGTN